MNFEEKYKPEKFSDIVGQDETVESLKSMKENGELSHMLFFGSWGCGKTSMALVIKNEFDIELIKFRAHDFMRNGIMDIIITIAKHVPQKTYKAVLLDDFEKLSISQQELLRGTMDTYSKTCKFIVTCNNTASIDPGILSRCRIYYFQAIQEPDAIKRLKFICKEEGLKISDQDLNRILNNAKRINSEGKVIGFDLRQCIKYLEDLCNRRR